MNTYKDLIDKYGYNGLAEKVIKENIVVLLTSEEDTLITAREIVRACKLINNSIGYCEFDMSFSGRRHLFYNYIERALKNEQLCSANVLYNIDKISEMEQQKLLKVLEERNKNMLFILCSNSYKDVIQPIKSRCAIKIEV